MLFSCSPVLYWFAAKFITTESTKTKVNPWNVLNNSRIQQIELELNDIDSYWNILLEQLSNIKEETYSSIFVLSYFVSYFLIGTILFPNFLPWT